MNKQLAIAESIINTAMTITDAAKQLPKTGKKRNIFIKTYNRRPNNKKKRALAIAQMAFRAYMGAVRLSTIISQPTPKYAKGSV